GGQRHEVPYVVALFEVPDRLLERANRLQTHVARGHCFEFLIELLIAQRIGTPESRWHLHMPLEASTVIGPDFGPALESALRNISDGGGCRHCRVGLYRDAID